MTVATKGSSHAQPVWAAGEHAITGYLYGKRD